jgi:hypothetical protein
MEEIRGVERLGEKRGEEKRREEIYYNSYSCYPSMPTVSAVLIIQGYDKGEKSYDRLRFFTAPPHMYRNPALSSSPPCPSTISR